MSSLVGHNNHQELELPGAWDHLAIQVLVDLVISKGPTVLFLMETKLLIQEMIPIKDKLGYRSMLMVLSVR